MKGKDDKNYMILTFSKNSQIYNWSLSGEYTKLIIIGP